MQLDVDRQKLFLGVESCLACVRFEDVLLSLLFAVVDLFSPFSPFSVFVRLPEVRLPESSWPGLVR